MGATSPTVACICMLVCTTPRAHDHPYSHLHHSSGASATSPATARWCIQWPAPTITLIRLHTHSHHFNCSFVVLTCICVLTLTPALVRSLAWVPHHQPLLALARWCIQWPAHTIVHIRLHSHYHLSDCSLTVLTCTCVHDAHTLWHSSFVRIRSFAHSFEFHLPRRHCHPITLSAWRSRPVTLARLRSFIHSFVCLLVRSSSIYHVITGTRSQVFPTLRSHGWRVGDMIWAVSWCWVVLVFFLWSLLFLILLPPFSFPPFLPFITYCGSCHATGGPLGCGVLVRPTSCYWQYLFSGLSRHVIDIVLSP
jgi:hypothetical protein